MQNDYIDIDIEKKFKRDMLYIENDIIAKQPEPNKYYETPDEKYNYVKFCKPLNTFAVLNMTKAQYKKYWTTQYKNYPNELKIILEKVEEKFKNGLISAEEMLELIENSNDADSEKKNARKALTKKKKIKDNNENSNTEGI